MELVSARGSEARGWFESAHASDPGWALPLAHLSLISLVENDMKRAVSFADEAVRHTARTRALIFALRGAE